MIKILVLTNVTIFILISLLHFYWAFGGTWGIDAAVPERFMENYHNPKYKSMTVFSTFVVAFGLLLFAFITASNANLFEHGFSLSHIKVATGIIGSIFLIRGIGDFNMFGLFKKKKDTKFSRSDTKIYIPLCLFIATVSFLITFLNS